MNKLPAERRKERFKQKKKKKRSWTCWQTSCGLRGYQNKLAEPLSTNFFLFTHECALTAQHLSINWSFGAQALLLFFFIIIKYWLKRNWIRFICWGKMCLICCVRRWNRRFYFLLKTNVVSIYKYFNYRCPFFLPCTTLAFLHTLYQYINIIIFFTV